MSQVNTRCPTMNVKRLADGAEIVINVADFDADLHEADEEGAAVVAKTKGGKKTGGRKALATD